MTLAKFLKMHIDEGKSVHVELPPKVVKAMQEREQAIKAAISTLPVKEVQEKIKRTLTIRYFQIDTVQLGKETRIENGCLTIRKSLESDALLDNPYLTKLEIDVIPPAQRAVRTNTVMDFMPVAVKVEGKIGEGVTHALTGAYLMITGTDQAGKQIFEFGSSEGTLTESVKFNMPGTPGDNDIIIRINATIKAGTGMVRMAPYQVHLGVDVIAQEIRNVLRDLPAEQAERQKTYKDISNKGKLRILFVKEMMGEGAMHDSVVMPTEPAGVAGGHSIIDLGNMPVVLSPNEVRDGGIHSMT